MNAVIHAIAIVLFVAGATSVYAAKNDQGAKNSPTPVPRTTAAGSVRPSDIPGGTPAVNATPTLKPADPPPLPEAIRPQPKTTGVPANMIRVQNGSGETNDGTAPNEGSAGARLASPVRNLTAADHMSAVAAFVESLLALPATEDRIGQQVREIAQQQKVSQQQMKTDLDRMESRKGFLKSAIGPDYAAIKDMRRQLEQTETRMSQLEQLRMQLTNEDQMESIGKMMQSVSSENAALRERIAAEEKTGGALGWLFKLFAF